MLTDEMVRQGNFLFKRRSYVPLVFLIVLLLAMSEFRYMGDSHTLDLAWEALCIAVSLFGLAIRGHVVGHTPSRTSGRNTKHQVAETLNTTGLYSLVRHPLYVGNLFMWLGVAMFLHDWRIVLLTVTIYWLYYERIMAAEEVFLAGKFGQRYRDWAATTPAFVPTLTGMRHYVRPSLPFSLRTVFKREYTGFFLIFFAMFCLEIIGDAVVLHELHVDTVWLVILAMAGGIYLTLRTLKRRTELLQVEGR